MKAENQAFGTFFAGLAAHGITKQNTLFVVTADEGDHFVGGTASPVGCDGVHVACTYSKLGEVDGNLNGLAAAGRDHPVRGRGGLGAGPLREGPAGPDRVAGPCARAG